MHSVKPIIACHCLVWLLVSGFAQAQPVGRGSTVEGDILRGQGAFLQGAGWYNLRTAQANSINVDATIRWKQDLRNIQREREYRELQKKYEKNQNVEEFRRKMKARELELRTNPSPEDVQSGAALNALVYDLTDPDITSYQWGQRSIPLPPGVSVKELVFSFTPNSGSTQASAALSRGVIALSRLDIKDKWPSMLMKDELAKERQAYEVAYQRARDKVISGAYAIDEILAIDTAISELKKKIDVEIPNKFNFHAEAIRIAEDLRLATRMFHADSVDYAREILIDTKDHDATTVQELVAFMTKYRLQFANSNRSGPAASELYRQIYEKLHEQAKAFDIKPGAQPEPPNPDPVPSDPFKVGAVLSGTRKGSEGYTQSWNLRISKRDKEKFAGEISIDKPSKKGQLEKYSVEGTVNGKAVHFKSERRSGFEQVFDGTVNGENRIELKYSGTGSPKGKATSGTATLSPKK
jgi:hypothetical protein